MLREVSHVLRERGGKEDTKEVVLYDIMTESLDGSEWVIDIMTMAAWAMVELRRAAQSETRWWTYDVRFD